MKTLVGIIIGISILGCANDSEKLFSAQGGGGSASEGGVGSAGGAAEGGGGSASGQGGQNTGGSGGDGGETSTSSGACIPKTCETIAVELNGGTQGNPESCGLVLDGCGNYIDCGGCSDEHQDCGLGNYEVPNVTDQKLAGVENLCGGNCAKQNLELIFSCPYWLSGDEWLCSKPLNSLQNCEPACEQLPCALWCCNN